MFQFQQWQSSLYRTNRQHVTTKNFEQDIFENFILKHWRITKSRQTLGEFNSLEKGGLDPCFQVACFVLFYLKALLRSHYDGHLESNRRPQFYHLEKLEDRVSVGLNGWVFLREKSLEMRKLQTQKTLSLHINSA